MTFLRVVAPVIAVHHTAFLFTITGTELWVGMVVIIRAAFFGANAFAVVVFPIVLFIATLKVWIARWAVYWVFSPSLLWAAIKIWIAFTSERVGEPSVIICSTAIIS